MLWLFSGSVGLIIIAWRADPRLLAPRILG